MSKPDTPRRLGPGGMDLDAFDALTDEQIAEGVARDPDAVPSTPESLAAMRRVALCRFIRHKLSMSQKKFAEAYDIPLASLLAWERHEAEPDAVALAYLRAIERNPAGVRKVPA